MTIREKVELDKKEEEVEVERKRQEELRKRESQRVSCLSTYGVCFLLLNAPPLPPSSNLPSSCPFLPQLVATVIAAELQVEQNVSSVEKVVNTDDENEEEEYEAWKVRELRRIKRDREEREK